LAEADRLVPGDILVTETTILPWTPLFASISGLVTNAGGILCHSAIVAREYGIPAVVGTGMATQAIQDGQLIEVDGTRGLVRILSQ
jgi:pyruvate,water dikinase